MRFFFSGVFMQRFLEPMTGSVEGEIPIIINLVGCIQDLGKEPINSRLRQPTCYIYISLVLRHIGLKPDLWCVWILNLRLKWILALFSVFVLEALKSSLCVVECAWDVYVLSRRHQWSTMCIILESDMLLMKVSLFVKHAQVQLLVY